MPGYLLSRLDWLIVAGYAAGLIALGLLSSRRLLRPVDYFLASRATRWPVIGLALLASNMSATALVGLSGGAYAAGISVYNYEWTACLALVFFCVFMVPMIVRSRTYTMPEFLEHRYDGRLRLQFALLTLFLNIAVDSAGILYCGALVCQLIVPSWPLWGVVLVLACSAGAYTIAGGLRAVIYTEATQAIVLIFGAALIALRACERAGGWSAVMRQVDPAAISLIRPIGDASVPWPGLVVGIPLLGFYYWCTNQTIVQRVLSARDIEHARRGALFAGLLKLPTLFLLVLPGTFALLIFPHLPRADMVYPRLVLELLPTGAVGLVVGAFVAATMVSVASTINSASTLITMDVLKRYFPDASDANLVKMGRISTAALLAIAVCWAPQLQHFSSLWQYLQGVLAYVVPPVVVVFLFGLFWRGATADAAALTMRLGTGLGAAAFLANAVFGWTHVHFLYVAPLLCVVDSVLLVAWSLWRPAALSEDNAAYVWQRAHWQADVAALRDAPPWKDYRYQSAALLLLAGTLVCVFR